MKPNVNDTKQKHFFIRSYSHIKRVYEAIELIKKNAHENLHISILGKFTREFPLNNERQQAIFEKQLKQHWKEFLGHSLELGVFKNPEFGTIFIIGSLTSMFLHEIDGKALGGMSAGLYGILRGLGAYQLQVDRYLEALNKGDYLLIVRGFDHELDALEVVLDEI